MRPTDSGSNYWFVRWLKWSIDSHIECFRLWNHEVLPFLRTTYLSLDSSTESSTCYVPNLISTEKFNLYMCFIIYQRTTWPYFVLFPIGIWCNCCFDHCFNVCVRVTELTTTHLKCSKHHFNKVHCLLFGWNSKAFIILHSKARWGGQFLGWGHGGWQNTLGAS